MSHDRFDVVLAGNYLTTLVAAVELARAGRKICVVNPVPTWGGHFTRIQVDGIAFDPGAISHEFTAYNDSGASDPLNYDSRRRNDWGRFTRLIEAYTRSHIDLERMPMPATVFDGDLHPDVVMGNRLDVLQHPLLKGKARQELAHLMKLGAQDLHPRHKKTSPVFVEKSYYDVSLQNHGATLHCALFEPMFHKMSNISTTRLLALYHRIAWLPLYYPETLLSQYGEVPQQLPETYFCYPKAGYVGAFAEALVRALQAAGVEMVREGIARLEGKGPGPNRITLKNGRVVEAPRLVWSLAHDQIVADVTGKPPSNFERWSAMLVFVTVPRRSLKRDFSVLYAPDEGVLFYRASNQTTSAGQADADVRIVFEINPDYAAARGVGAEDEVVARLRADLQRLGIVDAPGDIKVVGVRTMRNVLLLPSAENWKVLETERDVLLDAYPNVAFTRNVESFFTDTLNDQIIKGLKIAAQLRAS